MNLMQTMTNDLSAIYNTNEFGISAEFNSNPITVFYFDEIEISNSEEKVVSAISTDVNGVSIGDSIIVDDVEYEINNFDYKDNTQLETLLVITEV